MRCAPSRLRILSYSGIRSDPPPLPCLGISPHNPVSSDCVPYLLITQMPYPIDNSRLVSIGLVDWTYDGGGDYEVGGPADYIQTFLWSCKAASCR